MAPLHGTFGLRAAWHAGVPDDHAVAPRADRILGGPCFAIHDAADLAGPFSNVSVRLAFGEPSPRTEGVGCPAFSVVFTSFWNTSCRMSPPLVMCRMAPPFSRRLDRLLNDHRWSIGNDGHHTPSLPGA